MTNDEMAHLTSGLTTKSEKIRVLADHGVPRSDIARYLNIRYQHVRNVLVAPKPKRAAPDIQSTSMNATDALTLEQAKRGLSVHFGVPADAIEITIRG